MIVKRTELGPLDILVCSAGITGASLSTVDVSDEEWRRVLAINTDGTFFANRAVIAGMMKSELIAHPPAGTVSFVFESNPNRPNAYGVVVVGAVPPVFGVVVVAVPPPCTGVAVTNRPRRMIVPGCFGDSAVSRVSRTWL